MVGCRGDPVIAAAGDIACDPTDSDFHGGTGTSQLLPAARDRDLINSDSSISAVLALGDNQYGCGGLTAYQKSFAPAGAGSFRRSSHARKPRVPKERRQQLRHHGHAKGYFSYFGASATGDSHGDYAWDTGTWHMIELNGNCGKAGGCGSGSAQETFLEDNLGSSTCTLAYWHQPYYSGTSSPSSSYKTFWQTLYNAGADIVLNGHQHSYARFSPQNASGAVDSAKGVREFIVGTGGDDLFSLPGTKNVQFTTKKFGVLKLHCTPPATTGSSSPKAAPPPTQAPPPATDGGQ